MADDEDAGLGCAGKVTVALLVLTGTVVIVIAGFWLFFVLALQQWGDDAPPDRPAIVNASGKPVVIYVILEAPYGSRDRVQVLRPGERWATGLVAACSADRRSLVAERRDGTVVDTWDDSDCGDLEDVPDEWRIRDPS